jgi:predicted kinase
MVHHIEPIDRRPDLRLDKGNLLSLCWSCHEAIHGRRHPFALRKLCMADITIVCGPPGSGKSSYVRRQAEPGELVWDQDEVLRCIGGYSHRVNAPHLIEFALAMRKAVFEKLKRPTRVGRAWVIVGGANREERARLVQELGARVVMLALPAEECMARIRGDENRAGTSMAEWEEAVQRWWQEYQP